MSPGVHEDASLLDISVFGSVVVIVFEIIFRVEIYVNNIFLFFKNYF